MVYAPQRRHAVASLSTTLQALAVLQHLYAPSFWVLFGRLLAQLQVRAPPILSPNRSLLGLFLLVTLTNGLAVLFHWGAGPPDGQRGVPIDFVGQKNQASMTRIILLDIVIFALQLIMLIVCYVVNYGPTLPSQPNVFPFTDLLLPPDTTRPIAVADLDVESGDQVRQRRLGKGSRYQQVATDETDLWLDEEVEQEDDGSLRSTSNPRLVATSYTSRRYRSGVPLIFNISIGHLLTLVFRLAAPTPVGLTSGGTPLQSPPSSPLPTQDRTSLLAAALVQATANQEEFTLGSGIVPTPAPPSRPHEADPRRSSEFEARPDEARPEREDEGDNSGRIPGDYWASEAHP